MVANCPLYSDTGLVEEEPVEARNRGQRGAGSDGAPGSALRARPGEAARVVLWALTFAATFWAGNSTIIGNSGFALFWPASAVAAVWFATSPFGRPRPAEIALLAAVAGGTAYALDLPGWQVLAAAAGAPVAATVFTLLARRWAPEMWTASGPREMRSLREYGALVGAAIAAGAAEACVALVTLLAEPGPRFEQAGEIAITHTIAMVTLGGAGITVAGWLAGTPPRRARPAGSWPVSAATPRVVTRSRRSGWSRSPWWCSWRVTCGSSRHRSASRW